MASIETLERHQTMASELLAQEARRPTIDAAVKSFLSLYTARTWTSSSTFTVSPGDNGSRRRSQPARDQRSPSLPLTEARLLLKTINQYTFPLLPEPSDEYKVVAQLWNGLVASNQKPTKFLGARSLALAYQYGLAKEIKEEEQLKQQQQQQQANDGDDDANGRHSFCESDFLKEFQSLLLEYQTFATATGDSSRAKCTTTSATTPTGANGDEQPSSATPAASVLATTTTETAVSSFDNGRDSDACLIWDADRGHAELARRRARRAERAKAQMAQSVAQEQQQEQSSSSVTIEEIDEPSSTS